jgi:hypothetical protein
MLYPCTASYKKFTARYIISIPTDVNHFLLMSDRIHL